MRKLGESCLDVEAKPGNTGELSDRECDLRTLFICCIVISSRLCTK